ncbi:MAG TPA: sigma factor [Vicinamibacterales bacterium]|nr:sigma factor [Vicinamibacterales bacterium]
MTESDEELIAAVAAGDREAFGALYRRRRADVYRFALHMMGTPSAAEDVAQDVFMVVIHEKMMLAERKMRSAAAAGGGSGVMIARGITPTTAGPLEHKTLEGVAVEGRKTTTIIPAGQVGNEQPLTITSEEWRSPELNVLVMTRHSDPRMGDSSYRLQNIIRAEPDRSLFIVPADYTVKDTGIKRMLEVSRKQQ